MELVSNQVNIDSKVAGDKISSIFALSDFNRYETNLNDYCSLLNDYHRTNSVHFNYLRIQSSKKPLLIQFPEFKSIDVIQKRGEFDLFLSAEQNNKKITMWLPSNDFEIQLDPYQRISENKKLLYSYNWEFFPNLQLYINGSCKNESFLIIPFIVFEDLVQSFLFR